MSHEANGHAFFLAAPRPFRSACRRAKRRRARCRDQRITAGCQCLYRSVERGASTDLDGQFAIANVGTGSHTLVVSFIGYKEHRSPVVVEADAVELFVELMPEIFRGKEIIIVADRAKMRETPVAFSDVPKADMQRKLGSCDLPLILNDTPSVYVTAQGGGPAILASMCGALTSATSPL